MKKQIAALVKNRRLQLGLTQKELAEGICAQPVISSIESGQVSPSVDLFSKIIRKLNVSSKNLAELFKLPQSSSSEFYTSTLKDMLYSHNYTGIHYILDNINPESLSPLQQQYYLWLQYSMLYFINHKTKEALAHLKKLAQETEAYSDLYLKIYDSIATIYVEEKKYDSALTYYNEIVPFEKNMLDSEMFSKILYNLSKIYFFKKNLAKASSYCTRAIDYLIATHRLSLLGECYLMQTIILEEQGNFSEAMISCERAICLFAIENNYTQKIAAQTQLATLKKLQKNQ